MTIVTATHTLTMWGILRAGDAIEASIRSGIPLDLACAMLEQESGGGRNVFGHDGVATGGAYVKGAEVTRESYLRYKAVRATLGAQGVGPMQLTYPPLQDRADAAGGCFDPRINMLVGFQHLADLIKAYGLTDGVRRYNGSGPAAENYKLQVLAKRAKWTTRIGQPLIDAVALSAAPIPLAPAASSPTLAVPDVTEDDVIRPVEIHIKPDGSFRGAGRCENGPSSAVFEKAWFGFGITWGSANLLVSFLGADGLVMGPEAQHREQLGQNGSASFAAPTGAVMVTAEGQVFGDVIPVADVIFKPK